MILYVWVDITIRQYNKKPNPCDTYNPKESNGVYEIDIYQNAKKIFIPKYGARYIKGKENETCHIRHIYVGYAFENGELVPPKEGYREKIKIIIQSLGSSYKGIENFVTENKQQTNAELFSEKIEMKHFPLWFYPKYEMNFPDSFALYGIKGTNNPRTNRPFTVTCSNSFVTDSDKVAITQEEVINSKKVVRTLYPCRGSYYFVRDDMVFYVETFIRSDAVKDLDKIYAQLENKLDSYTKPPQPSL